MTEAERAHEAARQWIPVTMVAGAVAGTSLAIADSIFESAFSLLFAALFLIGVVAMYMVPAINLRTVKDRILAAVFATMMMVITFAAALTIIDLVAKVFTQ